jgi:hypothetical protein
MIPTVSRFDANCTEAVINSKDNAKQSNNILSNESSEGSSTVSVRSKRSGKGSKRHHNAVLRKILKKIKKQQKQYKKIDKIFLAEKQNRDLIETPEDPYIQKIDQHMMNQQPKMNKQDQECPESAFHLYNKVQ